MSHRLRWSELPKGLRQLLEERLGASVVSTVGATGGYSPAMACVAALSDGRSVFLKASSSAQNPHTPDIMRGEAEISRALSGAGAPAPRLLDAYDDDTWVVLAFDTVDGRLPATPWIPSELTAVARSAARIAEVPVPAFLPPVEDLFGEKFTGWARLRSRGVRPDRPSHAPTWWEGNLDLLCELEAASLPAIGGAAFVHGDVRRDNSMLTEDGVVFVDWTSCCAGAPWLDLVCMAPSVQLEGGPPPDEFLRLAETSVPSHLLAPAVAGLAGYFVASGLRPPPPGMPTVRAVQRDQGEAALRWLRELLG